MTHTQISAINERHLPVDPQFTFSSKVYDATLRPFLLGRRRLIQALPIPIEKKANILEVGCGAGNNLQQLVRWFPNALVTGMDVSSHMISKARQATAAFRNRVELLQAPYLQSEEHLEGQPDAIVFSYALTPTHTDWRALLRKAAKDLRPGGFIAVVDFHQSSFSWLKAHLANRDMQIDRGLRSFLHKEFTPVMSEVRPAYGGLWEYFSFVGKKA